ncbi:RluA family pseudouridine synthase, partial [Staphylococcus pseudintermedius]
MKFKVADTFNERSIRDIFKTLQLPKKELHTLNMSKSITVND